MNGGKNRMCKKQLHLEQLETRLLLAAPAKPFDLDLVSGDDSGSADTDDLTNVSNATISMIAETDSTVAVYNAGLLGTATDQDDVFFVGTDSIVVEAEKGAVADGMVIEDIVLGAGHVGSGYIRETGVTTATLLTAVRPTTRFMSAQKRTTMFTPVLISREVARTPSSSISMINGMVAR